MQSREILITNKTGLHARPASDFAKEAAKFKSAIAIEFNGKKINAKSIIHILSAGIISGSTITLSTDGEDEQQALDALAEVIAKFKD